MKPAEYFAETDFALRAFQKHATQVVAVTAPYDSVYWWCKENLHTKNKKTDDDLQNKMKG